MLEKMVQSLAGGNVRKRERGVRKAGGAGGEYSSPASVQETSRKGTETDGKGRGEVTATGRTPNRKAIV